MPIYANHIKMPHLTLLPRLGHAKSSIVHGMEFVDSLLGGMEKLDKDKEDRRRRSLENVQSSLSIGPPPTMDVLIESPPLVCYGPPKDSTGALLSGQLRLNLAAATEVECVKLRLMVELVYRNPVAPGCKECSTSTNEVTRWDLIREPTKLAPGPHQFPFSYLLPGHTPATTTSTLIKISYFLIGNTTTAAGDDLALLPRFPLTVARSILPGPDRNSIRIFPPTNLSAAVVLPSVIHPGGDIPLTIRLDGVVNPARNTRWRLRKLNWRIEEAAKALSPACSAHQKRLGSDSKGLSHEDVRVVGSGEMKTGWKNDFSNSEGCIEMELTAAIPARDKAACDLEITACGLLVRHALVVEMIVAEELAVPQRLPTPTGAARILKMQFQLCVTERPGLGISWDEEAPPVYEDVPESPPGYKHADVIEVDANNTSTTTILGAVVEDITLEQ